MGTDIIAGSRPDVASFIITYIMAKLKLRKGTRYPFKHLERVGDRFTVTDATKKNVNAAYLMYKSKNNIACNIQEYEGGKIEVIRIA